MDKKSKDFFMKRRVAIKSVQGEQTDKQAKEDAQCARSPYKDFRFHINIVMVVYLI